jgi:hypothetical protein
MRELLTWLLDVLIDPKRQTSSPMAGLERSIAAALHAHTSTRLAVAMRDLREDSRINRIEEART